MRLASRESGVTITTAPLGWRSSFRLFGIRFAWSRYHAPLPAASGAQLAIHRSFWIYTRRHAFGFGQVQDWAMLQYIEWSIEGQPWYTSETGSVKLMPPAVMTVPVTGRSRSHDETFKLHIRNRNQVAADCEFEFHGAITGDDPAAIAYYRARHICRGDSGAPAEYRQQLTSATVRVPGTTSTTANIHRPTLTQFEIYQVNYFTAPIGPKRWSRIHGRPEWND